MNSYFKCLPLALVIIFALSSKLVSAEEPAVICLDKPSGYMPNPKAYPDFFDRKNPIHKAVVLHRRHLNCADDSSYEPAMKGEKEQRIVIHTVERDYCNYLCRNRKEEQCYKDGSFDTYYDEWCEDADGQRIEIK